MLSSARPLSASAVFLLIGLFAVAPSQSIEIQQTPSPSPAATPLPAVDTDDTWLVDALKRRYRRDPLPKAQGHEKIEEGRVRTVWGIVVDIDGEDAENFFVKVYKTDDSLTGPVVRGPSESDKAAVADTYRFDLPTAPMLSFEHFDTGLPQAGQWRNGFALADMNGDGATDLVHGPARKRVGPPVIFLGDGKGSWKRWTEATFPAQRFDYGDVAVADFDGDGRPDMALGMHLLGVTALINEGAGRFRASSQGMDKVGTESAFSSRAIMALDWDNDKRTDLVVLGEGARLQLQNPRPLASSDGLLLYRNRGDGTWEKKLTGGRAISGDGIVSFRLNKKQLALASGTNTRGATTLIFTQGVDTWAAALPFANLRPQALVRSLAVADLDRDGLDDLIVGYSTFELGRWRSGIDAMLQRPQNEGWERQTVFVEENANGVTALATGKLNRDALPDLVALTGDGRVLVLIGEGSGRFTRDATELTKAAEACRGYRVEIFDLDKDGFGDIVAGFAGEEEGFLGLTSSGCAGEGSLRAWRVRPLPPSPSDPVQKLSTPKTS